MSKIYENMNAAELPITEIDEKAVVTMHVSDDGSVETAVQIKIDNEAIRINSETISISLESSTAGDLWKAYYLPMYHQAMQVLSAMDFIVRATGTKSSPIGVPMTITYYAESDSFMIEYWHKKYILSARSNEVKLTSKHPIGILASPVFEVNNPAVSGYHYSLTLSTTKFLTQLTTGYSIFNYLESLMYGAEKREDFLAQYKLKHQ